MKFVRENLMTLLILLGVGLFTLLSFLDNPSSDYLVCGLFAMGAILIFIIVMNLIDYASRTEYLDDVEFWFNRRGNR